MDDFAKLLTTFLGAVVLIMALVLMVSVLRRSGRAPLTDKALMGTLFSVALLYTMSDPIDLGAAGQFDMRGLLISAAAALIGPLVGAVTLVTGVAYRVMIGPPGLTSGLIGMAAAFAAGLIYHIALKERAIPRYQKTLALGVLAMAQLLGIFAAPPALWGELAATLLPYGLVTNLLGIALLSHLLGGELSFLSEAEAARKSANTDHLTGLLNRRGFEAVCQEGPAVQHHPQGWAVLCFDVDRFKALNDTHGHTVGDEILAHITTRVGAVLRPQDVFARLGGDEFVAILRNVPPQTAEHIAERCRAEARGEMRSPEGEIVQASVSIGVVWSLGPTTMQAMLKQADRTLYLAKSRGRDRIEFQTALTGLSDDRIAA